MDNYIKEFPQEESVDFKQLFFKFYRYWYFFIITIFIALTIAFLFNKYTQPIYKVGTTVLIKDDKSSFDPQALLGLGNVKNAQVLENEIGVLKSRSLVTRAIQALNFNISYFEEDNFLTKEIYKDSPFTVVFDTAYPQPAGLRFNLIILPNNEFTCRPKANRYFYTITPKANKLKKLPKRLI
ncbi:MAG: Wzz/FepE/Etk N-terminal domain-containing protein [Lentimicrobium sp.]|nr:Wzz/FepE/Etk N-terminal domain-containing protein [Lentimicrobium sp.]